MKLKSITLALAALCLSSMAFAQNPNTHEEGPRAQTIYFEVLGPGITYSVNYDTRFQNTRNGFGGRIGVSYLNIDDEGVFSLPVGLNYLLGKNKHYFEMGVGATYYNVSWDEQNDPNNELLFIEGNRSSMVGNLTFGYRLQPVDGGFNFRAGFTPTFGKGFFMPYFPHLSLGYTF